MKFLAFVFLILALIMQTSLTTLPIIFLVLICLTVILRENWLFAYAFFFGFLFDVVSFKTIGTSSLFFVIFLFLVLAYQRKFEISTNYFILSSSFLGSLGYLLLFFYGNFIIFQAVVSAIIGLLIFLFLKRIEGKK